jgi:hypothetical protein
MSAWTEADSRDLDREVKALRQAERRERTGERAKQAKANGEPAQPKLTSTNDKSTKPRPGSAAAMSRRALTPKPPPKPRRPPRPKQMPSGRWLAVVKREGVQKQKTFDTPAQAEAWIDQLINDTEED